MMSVNKAVTTTLREPCALQHYLRQMNPNTPSYVLSPGQCQMAFQHWVAYVRGSDGGYPSDITAKEHLRCPLLWCRENFDNLTATLQHVSECPWLSNAWYWCPYCCRPESFTASEEPCVNPRQSHIQRKDSRLRRAVTFFKQLGLKGCSRHKTSGSSSTSGIESFDTWFGMWLAEQREFEMEDTSHEVSRRAELADSSSGRGSYIENRANNINEMEDTAVDTSQDPYHLSRFTQVADSTTQPCELDVEPLIKGPQFRAELASPTSTFTAIGAQFESSPHNVEASEEMLWSPASDVETVGDMLVSPTSTVTGAFSYESAVPIASPHVALDSPSPAYTGANTVSLPEVVDHHAIVPIHNNDRYLDKREEDVFVVGSVPREAQAQGQMYTNLYNHRYQYPLNRSRDQCHDNVDPPFGAFSLSSEYDRNILDNATLSTQFQTEHLRDMVRILNEEWLRRCQSKSDLLLRGSVLSPQSLLDKGAQTLQLVFQDVLPDTFDAMFALAHFACAAAYIIHGDSSSHCWNEFFQHILNLHNLIRDESDAQLFIQLVNLLFWPQCSSAQRSCGNYFLDESSGTLVPLRRPVVGLDGLLSTSTFDLQAPRYPTKPASVTAVSWLKCSAVFQECSRFLDGIEYAGILERNTEHPTHLPRYSQNHSTSIQEMLKTVIHPLQKCDGIEALHNVVKYTVKELSSGALRSIREVEVSLISNSPSSSLSPNIYKRYRDTVKYICDQIMHKAGPNWRDRCYATDTDMVLASLIEIANLRRRCNVNPIPQTIQTLPRGNLTPSSIESQTLISSSPPTITSPTFTGGYSSATKASPTTSPESSFSAPVPSSPCTDVTRCSICGAIFTGSKRDRATNLRRHMRTTRDHGNVVGLACTVPGCSKILSRSDNLGKHVRTVHGADTDAVLWREGARKRKRDTEGTE